MAARGPGEGGAPSFIHAAGEEIPCEINVCAPPPPQKWDVVVASLTNCWTPNNLYIMAAEGTRRLYFL